MAFLFSVNQNMSDFPQPVSFFSRCLLNLTDLRRIEGDDVGWDTAAGGQESCPVLLSQTGAVRLPSLTFLGFLLQRQERFRHLDLLDVRQVVSALTMKYDRHRVYTFILLFHQERETRWRFSSEIEIECSDQTADSFYM